MSRRVLELGAGGGLPSIIAHLQGCAKVVVTDYPDKELVDNIEYNVRQNVPNAEEDLKSGSIVVKGHLWGSNTNELLECLNPNEKFDVIVLADLLFNHQGHEGLLKTCRDCLATDGKILLSVTHHRPLKMDQDLHFFALAQQGSLPFKVTKLFSEIHSPMFDDFGSEEVRATVHFYVLEWT